jgi:hypothetical protein
MKINVEVQGIDNIRRELKKRGDSAERSVKAAVLGGALMVQAESRRSIQRGPKTGRRYKKSKNVTHIASAPGQPPATDTGRLVSGVLISAEQGGYAVRVGTNIKYGKDLEYGTRKMAARPWLFPALKNNGDKLLRSIRLAVKRALNGRV